jgi:hypothetical protein
LPFGSLVLILEGWQACSPYRRTTFRRNDDAGCISASQGAEDGAVYIPGAWSYVCRIMWT